MESKKTTKDFVEYAQKLGYRRDMGTRAEQRVGEAASLNTKMMALLNLAETEKRWSGSNRFDRYGNN